MGRKRLFNVFTFAALTASFCFLAPSASFAVERNSSTNKFNWGDDLSETVVSPGGVTQRPGEYAVPQFKTNHFPDIKQAIDQSVTACNITDDVYVQTDREAISQIGYPGKPVSSKHVNNLRRAIEELYRKKGQAPPAYLAGDVNSGDPILKRHIHDMRRALDDLVVGCAPDPGQCGGSCTWIWNGLNWDDYCMGGTPGSCFCTPGGMGGPPGVGDPNTLQCDCPPCGGPAVACYERAEGFGPLGGCDNQVVYYPASAGGCGPEPGGPCNGLTGPCTPIYAGSPNASSCSGTPSCLADGADVPAGHINNEGPALTTLEWGECCSGRARMVCVPNEPCEAYCVGGGARGGQCGNGTIERLEQCDDGNTSNGDGCSSFCRNELAACQADGYTWTRGRYAILVDEIILDERCCTGTAICYSGTNQCSCERPAGGDLLCGNGICSAVENCTTCPQDCGACAPTQTCGNSVREGTEACDLGMSGNGPCPKTCSTLCATNVCAPAATCSDGIQNQGETGVDCGGPCAACGGGNVGPCGAAVCYRCGGINGSRCVQDNINGTYDDPACYGDCDLGGGGFNIQ